MTTLKSQQIKKAFTPPWQLTTMILTSYTHMHVPDSAIAAQNVQPSALTCGVVRKECFPNGWNSEWGVVSQLIVRTRSSAGVSQCRSLGINGAMSVYTSTGSSRGRMSAWCRFLVDGYIPMCCVGWLGIELFVSSMELEPDTQLVPLSSTKSPRKGKEEAISCQRERDRGYKKNSPLARVL